MGYYLKSKTKLFSPEKSDAEMVQSIIKSPKKSGFYVPNHSIERTYSIE